MTGFNLVNDSSRKSILTQNILNQPEGNISEPGCVNHLTHCGNTPEIMLSGKKLKVNRSEPITNAQMCRTTPINKIAILGTHDSGIYEMENLTGISRCQKINLIQQAEQGAQYFDLRVRRNDEGGLQALAKSLHAKVATAFFKLVKENNFNPGIISMNFIGIEGLSSTALYRKLCKIYNEQVVPKISELLMAS